MPLATTQDGPTILDVTPLVAANGGGGMPIPRFAGLREASLAGLFRQDGRIAGHARGTSEGART
jgi:hypothetical protein